LLFPKLLYILKGKTFGTETAELNAVVKLLEKFQRIELSGTASTDRNCGTSMYKLKAQSMKEIYLPSLSVQIQS
jgi:hypothetical protein